MHHGRMRGMLLLWKLPYRHEERIGGQRIQFSKLQFNSQGKFRCQQCTLGIVAHRRETDAYIVEQNIRFEAKRSALVAKKRTPIQ